MHYIAVASAFTNEQWENIIYINTDLGNGTFCIDGARAGLNLDNIYVSFIWTIVPIYMYEYQILNAIFQQVIFHLFRRNFNNIHYRPYLNLQNVTLDYCHLTKANDMGTILLDLFAAGLRAHSNILQKCP